MIKIHKKDSIIDVIIKINNYKWKEIILDFPFGHPILHNYTSLKILKNKSGKKDLIIITSDKTAKNIWEKIWIKYSKIGDSDLLEYNYTFLEYLKYIIKRYFNEILNLFWNKSWDIIFEYQKKYWKWWSKIWFFLIWMIVSVLLFIFIFYFAVNKTYIYITPEIEIKTKAENFIFREVETDEISNNNIIELKKVSKLLYLTNTFWTSWINKDTLKKSKWKVVFYNELNEEVRLLKNTRLEDSNWTLFISDSEIIIPKAIISSTWSITPWKVKINITSKIYNNKWVIVWENANIDKWVLLTLPWLKENKNKIYAKTLWKIKWANNNYKKQLTQIDIDNAKKLLELKLKQKALNELKKQILEDNKNNNITHKILWVDDILIYSDFTVIWDKELKIWTDITDFKLSGTIKITSYTYNIEKVLNLLSNTVKSSTLKEIQKILYINQQSLRIADILYKKENPLEIKATAQVEVFLAHNFLNKENNYINKLKETIWWIDKNEALKILLNNSKISDVTIDIRPFFINKISKITDNIIIKVVEK